MNKDKSVQFMIIGSQKSGTSALAHFCSQHPQIEMSSPKEPHIFDATDYENVEVDTKYKPYFGASNGDKLCGEATPIYMYLPEVPERLYDYNPNLKLVILLRDPVERAVSHYCMERNRNNERLAFLLAILMEPIRLYRHRNNRQANSSVRTHSYMSRGDYLPQIKRLKRYFPDDQILLLDYEDLSHNHANCLSKLFDFLGVNIQHNIAKEVVFPTENKHVPLWNLKLLRFFFGRHVRDYKQIISKAQLSGFPH